MKPLIERITKSRVEFEVYVNKKDPAVPDAAIGVTGNWDVAYCAIKGQDEGESLANAELIAEAFNVAHETGKTPAELADEVTALRSSLSVMTTCTRLKFGNLDPFVYAEIEKAEKLLTP